MLYLEIDKVPQQTRWDLDWEAIETIISFTNTK